MARQENLKIISEDAVLIADLREKFLYVKKLTIKGRLCHANQKEVAGARNCGLTPFFIIHLSCLRPILLSFILLSRTF